MLADLGYLIHRVDELGDLAHESRLREEAILTALYDLGRDVHSLRTINQKLLRLLKEHKWTPS